MGTRPPKRCSKLTCADERTGSPPLRNGRHPWEARTPGRTHRPYNRVARRPGEDQPIEVQIVDAMNKLWARIRVLRQLPLQGVVVEGSFTASPQAAGLLARRPCSTVARSRSRYVSPTPRIPNVADGSGSAIPHGMSIKFHLPDGSDTDMVLNALKFFPVATGADFRDLLLALAAACGCRQADDV